MNYYFDSKKSGKNKEIGAFIENCIGLRSALGFFKFLLNSHSSTKVNCFKPVQWSIAPL